MSANRLRIAFSLTATIVVVLSPSAVGRGQQTQPPVADPAAAAATLDPPAFAEELDAEPTLPSSLDPAVPPPSSEPPATDDSSAPPAPIGQAEPPRQMRSPWRFEVQLRPNIERAPILETLEAHGFDVREYSKRGDGTVTWWVAPPSEADLELSDRRLRETLGRQTSVKLVGFSDERIHPRLAQSVLTNPIKSWFFKWTPSETDAAKQKEEWQRVAEALAASKLDIRSGSTRESNGDWYVYVNSSAEDIPKIEDVVRTVVQEPRFFRPPQLKNYLAQHVSNESVPSGIAAADRPTVIREGSVGNTTHPFQVTLSHVDTGDFSSHERTLEDEGFDVQTSTRRSATSMRIAPPTGVDLKTAGQRLAEVLGPKAEIRDELSSVPPQVAFLADLLSTRHWFFKWKGTDEADRDRVLKALSDSDVAIAELTWSRDPDGSWQVAIDSSPLDVEKLDGLVRTLVKEPKIWRPIGAATPQSPPAAAPGTEVPADASEAPTNPAAETPDEPKLTAKVLLIESDWEKANDRQAASRLAQSISNGIVEMSRAGVEVFRPGYAATFQRDEARTASDDMQRLGLVSQSLAMSAVDLGLSEEGVEALGAAQLSFGEKSSDGMSESVAWNVLIVTGEAPGHFAPGDPYSAPPPPRVHRVAVVAWKDRTAERLRKDGSTATEAGELVPPAADASVPDPSDESERYVGSFLLRTDQSAIVPLTVPGVKGAVIVVSRAQKGPVVRSLGPLSGNATQQPMTVDEIDWNDLIRAYEASPLGAPATRARMVELMQDASESAETDEAEVTFNWRPANEEQIDPLIDALARRYPQAKVVLRQLQGDRGATLVFRAPAESAETIAKELETIAAAIIPSESVMQVEISPNGADQEDERATLVFQLRNASSDEVAKLLDSLKLDPNIRLVSDPRTNSILLSAPDATKHKHVQALVDLLKALDQPAEPMPAKVAGAPTTRPDRRTEIEALRSRLAREEADVQQAAEMARAAPERERSIWVDSLRQVVVRAFDLRLRLQCEEAAELRDRLAKIEENLARRQRIQSAVIERRIEVLLDPALEWPEVTPENAPTKEDVAASTPAADVASASSRTAPSLPPVGAAPGLGPSDRRGDAFSAATSLAREIADLEEQAQAIERDGTPDGSEVRLALIRRQLELLRQEFDARQQALKLELESLNAKLRGAQASYERVRTMFDTGAISQEEVAKVEAELSAAKSDVARQEVLLQQYDRARASLPSEAGDLASIPPELQGTWRMTKHEVQDNPDSNVAPTTWILEGSNLTVIRKGLEDIVYVLEFPQDSPDEFRSFRVAKVPQGREIVERGFRYRYEIRDGALHVIQGAGDGRSLHKSVSPAPGVVYYEFERVAAGAGDEREPGASGPDSPAASSSSVNAEAQAERAATTALALRAADLYMEIRRIESQVPQAPHCDLAVSMLREQIDRLRKELEERRADVRKERAAHAVKLAVVQTRLDRAQRLATPKAQDLSITQAELASASATLASVDGVLATFDAAVKAFDEASRSNALPPDFGDDASGQALKRLQGFWVSTEQNGYSRFGTFSPEHAQIWLFAGKSMIWTGFASDAGYLYDVQIAGDADPPRLTLVFDGTPQSPASIRDYGFRFDGDALEVAERQDVSVDVDEVAPQPGIQYYRFERYGALEEALASFDIDAVDIEAIKNEGIQLPTTSQPAGSRTQGRDTSSFAEPIATARSHLRSLAIALVKSRDALQSSLDPALPAAESRRLRSQSYSQRAESFRHRDQFFAEKFYVESALANVRIRVESAASAEEREAIDSTQEKLAEYLTEIDRLARVARLPAPVALGPATGDPWYPYVNAEQGAYEPELSLAKHADELRKAEAQLAGLAPEDPAHQRALERRDYLLNGAREIRAFWRAALIRAEETIDETRSALSKAKRSQGSLGQSLDDVEREIAIAREEHRIARSTEIIDEYGRRLTELASAFPSLVEDAENDKTDASSSIPLSR